MTNTLTFGFAVRLAIGLAWLGVASAGALAMSEDQPMALRLLGLVAVGAPPLLWTVWLQRQARIDELEARLALVSQAQGGGWAVGFASLLWGINALRGDETSSLLLVFLAPAAFLFGECMAQVARMALHRPEKRRQT